jgi:hypothetical protein
MAEFLNSLGVFLGEVWRTLWLAVGLNPAAFDVVEQSARPAAVVIAVAAIAGTVRLLGECAVLFINQVSRRRFILTLAVEVVLYVVRLMIWGAVTWACAALLFKTERPFDSALAAVLLGSAPFIFGFLILVPHLGILFNQILRLWSFLATIALVSAVYDFGLFPSVVCAGLGWVAVNLLDEVTGRGLLFWRDVIWKRYLSPAAFRRAFTRIRLDG